MAKTICALGTIREKTPAYQQKSKLEGEALSAQVKKIKSQESFKTMMKKVSKEELADALIKGGNSLYEVFNKAVTVSKTEGQKNVSSEIGPESIKQEKGAQGLIPGTR